MTEMDGFYCFLLGFLITLSSRIMMEAPPPLSIHLMCDAQTQYNDRLNSNQSNTFLGDSNPAWGDAIRLLGAIESQQ